MNKNINYKFNEEFYLNQLKQYVDSTYDKHYASGKIQSLEKNVNEQGMQIVRVSEQLENAYQKVQDIAAKSVEGSSSITSLASLQQFLLEQSRKQQNEK